MEKELFEELIAGQEEKIFSMAEKIVPHITRDDIMQPNDFPQLEGHPLFRYEEGVLEGLRTARMAFLAAKRDSSGGK